jgi:Ran GTPase-activating protein (RanGAP) involved in mRNA processing and transport
MKSEKNMDSKEGLSNMWQGVVLEESLEDKSLLKMAKIKDTNVSRLEKENRVMTFHQVEVPDTLKEEYIEKAKNVIKQSFYTHLCKDGQMIVVFKSRVFNFTEDSPELNEAREYGKSIGIIAEQMPFERLVNNPFD